MASGYLQVGDFYIDQLFSAPGVPDATVFNAAGQVQFNVVSTVIGQGQVITTPLKLFTSGACEVALGNLRNTSAKTF